MRTLATILPLKSQFSGKLQRFNAIDGRNKRDPIRKPPQGNFSVFPQPTPHQIKCHYANVFGTRMFLRIYTEIYRHLLSKCFSNVVLGRQEMVKCKYLF